MAFRQGTSGNDEIKLYLLVLGPGENSHGTNTDAGNDTVYGSSINDLIILGSGNDYAQASYGDDTILGEDGSDIMYGESGNDLIVGGYGNDSLYGGQGFDLLRGNQGDDKYYASIGVGEGNDIINEDVGSSSNTGNGGGIDRLYIQNVTKANLYLQRNGNDLIVSTQSDAADGYLDNYITIQNHYLNNNNMVEYIYGSDNLSYYLG
ncbi:MULTISPECIES: calcium-binding protein [unclassified Azospirillum]|uniref:calcium-binding protein n=1 Tax=unclassified Azospirillum TaxID=2630922 RepID=UPI000B756F31|nr:MULTISPECIES: hypothetical protein [unclassified Azospirillum]SNR99647.1 Hemolysin-type calcium-binding repeat-containing protein [Azospirillum sp. RU38E]SNS17160.1 Hemolysin-type calcium-binding repeat-containing protein [Azospirillum sp. RU37A]